MLLFLAYSRGDVGREILFSNNNIFSSLSIIDWNLLSVENEYIFHVLLFIRKGIIDRSTLCICLHLVLNYLMNHASEEVKYKILLFIQSQMYFY